MNENFKKINSKSSFVLGLLAGVAVIIVVGFIAIMIMVTGGNNNNTNTGTDNVNAAANANTNTAPVADGLTPAIDVASVAPTSISTLKAKAGATICKEDGKPVIYLFSTTWCPHCKWISNTFDALAKEYVDAGKIVAYHWELDTGDNTLTSAVETKVPDDANKIYAEFNPAGSIPTFVLGCKYSRVGNGYEAKQDLKAEVGELKAAIEDLLK